MDCICSTAGVSLTAGLTSTRAAIPVDSMGRPAAVIRVCALASAAVHVHVGDDNVAAGSSHLLLCNGRDVAINVSGKTHIAVIQAGVGLGGLVNVVAYE